MRFTDKQTYKDDNMKITKTKIKPILKRLVNQKQRH
jgi:hypothetical protein